MSSSSHGDPFVPTLPNRVRAAIIDRPGAHPRIGMVALPAVTRGHSVLRVIAAPLNPVDLLIASGTFHSARHERPYVPGSECAAVVVRSSRYAPGTRVYAQCQAAPDRPGSLATHLVANDDDILALPPGLDPLAAVAVGNSGVTAYLSLIEDAGLQEGETVLILGATGVVGQLAVQIARTRGAARVIGVGRDRATLERLPLLGADAIVALRADESEQDLTRRLADAAGAVDVVLDGLCGLPLQAALKTCASRARVVNIGNLAGTSAAVEAGVLRSKQLTITGFAALHMSMQAKQPALDWLWRQISQGVLDVSIRTSALGDIAATWSEQSSSPHAKCVVVPA